MALPASVTAARSWPDFVAAVEALADTTAKGDAFEQLVAHYLRTDPIYRTKLARVWPEAELPAELRARLKLPSRDQGIDLVAETHTGEFWAIQAKYRADSAASIPFGELATFSSLTFHRCAGAFAYALVCTTTARITDALTGLGNLGELTAETWAALPAAFFQSLSAPTSTPLPPLVPRPPRPHQIQAIERAIAYFATPGQTRGKLIHPCGAGKSLTAYWIARDLEARRVLVAVPSLALVRQTLETWMTEALADGRAADWLCVCSDDEIASDFDSEELVARIHELGLPCDTDPAELEKHLHTAASRPGLLVVLTTYQSSPVLAQAARAAGTAFDFCVCDEAHKTTGASSSYYAHLLHDENLPLPRRLFMTATERRFASNRSDDIVSMDDPDLYGETIDLLTFKAAIAAEPPILCDYRLLTIGVRESEVRALVEQNRWLDLGPEGLDEVTSLALASLVALRRATAQYGVRHTVSFHSSILRASRFRDLNNRLNEHLSDAAPVRAFHVTGKMGSAARARELERFTQVEPSLVTNARCLTEGVDVPGIDCVFFADPRGSTIDIVQATGRALRLAKDKKLGYILLPLIVPDGATPEDLENSSGFRFILTVLRALAAQDDRIIEYFRNKTTNTDESTETQLIHIDATCVSSKNINPEDFAHEIELKCWKRVARLAFRTLSAASEWAIEQGIGSKTDWDRQRKQLAQENSWPYDIPVDPRGHYKKQGWTTWGDFLATGRIATKYIVFQPFDKARIWARSLNFKSSTQWRDYLAGKIHDRPARPIDIPTQPDKQYRDDGWEGWADFLDTERFQKVFMSFMDARAFVHKLELENINEWLIYKRGERLDLAEFPIDLPSNPSGFYRQLGWLGWGDFLGTGRIATAKMIFRPFAEAREWARSQNLSSSGQWREYITAQSDGKSLRPIDIPSQPDKVYQGKGWLGWADFLDSERFEKKFWPYEKSREWARSLDLSTGDDWFRYRAGEYPSLPEYPEDIPSDPESRYRGKGWLGWGDFLGTGRVANYLRVLWPYEKAREFAHHLNLRTSPEWKDYCDGKRPDLPPRPPEVPYSPFKSYRGKGWVSWDAFLAPRWRAYTLARDFAHSLKLSGQQHWKAYVAGKRPDLPPLPEDIPKAPDAAYRREGGWVSWGDWLGHGITAGVKRIYLPYSEARVVARSLGLTSVRAWHAFTKDKSVFPASLPISPHEHYVATGWISWSDWLGIEVKEPKRRAARTNGPQFRDFVAARDFVRALQLGGSLNWRPYVRGEFPDKPPKPADIPASPKNVYTAEWQGWGDFLGSGNIAPKERVFRPFAEARAYIRTLGFRTSADYRSWHKATRPADLPSSPNNTYADEGFVDWADFLHPQQG